MPKFIVEKDCHGFRNRLWKKGQIVEVSQTDLSSRLPNLKIPRHFKPLNGELPVVEDTTLQPVAISQLNRGREIKGGLAEGVAKTMPELDNRTLKPKKRTRKKTK